MPQALDTTAAALRNRTQALALRVAQLRGRQTADANLRAELIESVGLAKGRMALAPEVASVFEGLQTLAHQRSVGALEELLTAVLEDVLPGEGAIRLLPSYKSNTTHLDIALEKGGNLEDLVDGNGGAVTNVVCAGLRYAALARTGNRPVMVLDEPDCWLKPERVPAFVQTISQVSDQGGFQTFFITHHDPAFFEGKFNLVRFSAAADGVTATALSPLVTSWISEDQPGIRSIELINVRRHVHTVVPCFPGATAYIGDNNLGKSTALMAALKIVAYGESDESVIRHGCEEARIILTLEEGNRIEWSRSKKRSPTVVYRHYRGETLVTEGAQKTRNQVPEWVQALLGISRVDDLDIQVGNQKTPVFLLNDSAPRRAQILSVGRESGYLPTLMRAYEAQRTSDREAIKAGEAALTRLKLREAYLADLPRIENKLATATALAESVLAELSRREKLIAAIASMSAKERRVAALGQIATLQVQLPPVPALVNTDRLGAAIVKMARYERLTAIPAVPVAPPIPALTDVRRMRELGVRWARTQARVLALQAVEELRCELPTKPPELRDTARLQQRLQALTARFQALTNVSNEANALSAAVAAAAKDVDATVAELGGLCPICRTPLSLSASATPSTETPRHAHVH